MVHLTAIKNTLLYDLTDLQKDYALSAIYARGYVNPRGIENAQLVITVLNQVKQLVENRLP